VSDGVNESVGRGGPRSGSREIAAVQVENLERVGFAKSKPPSAGAQNVEVAAAAPTLHGAVLQRTARTERTRNRLQRRQEKNPEEDKPTRGAE